LAGETEVLGENLPQCHFVHHKSHLTRARTRAAAVGSQRLTINYLRTLSQSTGFGHLDVEHNVIVEAMMTRYLYPTLIVAMSVADEHI
jgi:hypothetical protein